MTSSSNFEKGLQTRRSQGKEESLPLYMASTEPPPQYSIAIYHSQEQEEKKGKKRRKKPVKKGQIFPRDSKEKRCKKRKKRKMGRDGGDGERGSWGDGEMGEMGRWGRFLTYPDRVMALSRTGAKVTPKVRHDICVRRVLEHAHFNHDIIQVLSGLEDDDLEGGNGASGKNPRLRERKEKKKKKMAGLAFPKLEQGRNTLKTSP